MVADWIVKNLLWYLGAVVWVLILVLCPFSFSNDGDSYAVDRRFIFVVPSSFGWGTGTLDFYVRGVSCPGCSSLAWKTKATNPENKNQSDGDGPSSDLFTPLHEYIRWRLSQDPTRNSSVVVLRNIGEENALALVAKEVKHAVAHDQVPTIIFASHGKVYPPPVPSSFDEYQGLELVDFGGAKRDVLLRDLFGVIADNIRKGGQADLIGVACQIGYGHLEVRRGVRFVSVGGIHDAGVTDVINLSTVLAKVWIETGGISTQSLKSEQLRLERQYDESPTAENRGLLLSFLDISGAEPVRTTASSAVETH